MSWQEVQQWQHEQLGDGAAQRKRQLLATDSGSGATGTAADDGGQDAA